MKTGKLWFYCTVFLILIFVLLTSGSKVFAETPEDYFQGASIETNITCYDVVSDANHVLQYDKVNLREDTEYMTAEWLDVSGFGSNPVNVATACVDPYGDLYAVTVTHSYDGNVNNIARNYTFSANSASLGTHTFVVSCVIKGKTIQKTIVVNVVRTVQGSGDIRYRTSGFIPKSIALLTSPNNAFLSFDGSTILPMRNLMLSSGARTTLNNMIPTAFRDGKECIVTGSGVITVYNIKTGVTLGTYRLDTKYNDLLDDFAWSSGAVQDFVSKKSFKIPYRNRIVTQYSIDTYDVETNRIIEGNLSGSIEFFAHQIMVYSYDLPPQNQNGTWTMSGLEYLFLFHLVAFDGFPVVYQANTTAYLTLWTGGAYDAVFGNKIGNNKSLKISYYFRNPRPAPTPSPTPSASPGPSTGTVVVNCFAKNTMQRIAAEQSFQVSGGSSRTFAAPSIAGYLHRAEDLDAETVNVSAGGTYFVNFYYLKLGSITIEHRDKATQTLLASREMHDLVLLENLEMQVNSYSPGYFPGYVHESYGNSAVPWCQQVLLTDADATKTVTFYYVKARCTIQYEISDADQTYTVKSTQVNLPLAYAVPERIAADGSAAAQGLFRYVGNDYAPGNTDALLSLSEWDSNATITLRYVMDMPDCAISITGAYQHWKNNAKRFMCLEKITIRCTAANVAHMVVRLSPPLEAMIYTSPTGIRYDYYDFFKKHVLFPADATVHFTDGSAVWRYSLPLANETISWEDERKRSPYYIAVSLEKDGFREEHRYNIDITGNVTDIIHPQ